MALTFRRRHTHGFRVRAGKSCQLEDVEIPIASCRGAPWCAWPLAFQPGTKVPRSSAAKMRQARRRCYLLLGIPPAERDEGSAQRRGRAEPLGPLGQAFGLPGRHLADRSAASHAPQDHRRARRVPLCPHAGLMRWTSSKLGNLPLLVVSSKEHLNFVALHESQHPNLPSLNISSLDW